MKAMKAMKAMKVKKTKFPSKQLKKVRAAAGKTGGARKAGNGSSQADIRKKLALRGSFTYT